MEPRRKPTKMENNMSKEQIRQAVLKKRECNAKAQKIVESLLEKDVSQEYLLQCLPDINQSHFEDVFEERAILNLCGYPICKQAIAYKDIPKQKYRISLKTNRVYDITERKNFCSNYCYKYAMYVKQQLFTSPLWFRDQEVIPHFCLVPPCSTARMGQEVDLGAVQKVKISSDKPVFTSINDFTKASMNEMTNDDLTLRKDGEIITDDTKTEHKKVEKLQEEMTKALDKLQLQNTKNKKCAPNPTNIATDVTKTEPKKVEKLEEEMTKAMDNLQLQTNLVDKPGMKNKKRAHNSTNIVGEIIERAEKKIDPILTQEAPVKPNETPSKLKKVQQKKQPLVTVLAIEVENCLAQWFTLDTILFLFGDEKVREMVTDKGESIKEYLNNYNKGTFYNSNAYDQYQLLCRKLNMLELEDKQTDTKALQRHMQPLPDYSILQEDSKKMQLKVKAYMSGELQIPEPMLEEKDEDENDGNTTQLPLVDKNSQNALRRRIVFQQLNKCLPDLLQSLGIQDLTVSSDVRLLVNTFKFQANNIMFKPIQWTLIALIFIKLLSIRIKRLEHLLEHAKAYQHMQLLLLSYKLDGGYLDRLLAWLTDIDRLIDTNDTQLISD